MTNNNIGTFAHILEASTSTATLAETVDAIAADTGATVEAGTEVLDGEILPPESETKPDSEAPAATGEADAADETPVDIFGMAKEMADEVAAEPAKRKKLSLKPILTDEEKAEAEAAAKPAKGKGKKGKGLETLEAAGRMDFDAVAAKAGKPAKAPKEPKAPKAAKPAKAEKPAEGPKEPRHTKTQDLIDMLLSEKGATGKELQEMFGWLPHTTRGAISTLHRKNGFPAGHKVVREKDDERGSFYRIVKIEAEG